MIHLTLPGIPPSANNAYINLPRGGRTLSTDGKKFKNETQVYLARTFPAELKYFVPNQPYLVFFRLTLTELQNKSWGAVKNGAENRYKKFDATNRIKLLEDVLKDVTQVDDANTMTFIVMKQQGPVEKTDIFVWALEREASPFDAFLRR